MAKSRIPARRYDPAEVRETRPAYRKATGTRMSFATEVELTDGTVHYRCNNCPLMWPTANLVKVHRETDEPHVAGGRVPPVLGELDMYTSSTAVVPAARAGVATPAARRRRDADPEAWLDAAGSEVVVSMTEFLDTLLASRSAARSEAAEQRDRAERAIREKDDMRKVLVQMRSMLDRVLGPTEQDNT